MALTAVSGSLASLELIDALASAPRPVASLRGVLTGAAAVLGPASAARQVYDCLLSPLLGVTGATCILTHDAHPAVAARVLSGGTAVAVAAATGWSGDLARLRDATARLNVDGTRWWIGTNGRTLRILDAARAYARRAIDIDLAAAAIDDRALFAVAGVLDTSAAAPLGALAALVAGTEEQRASVGRSLQQGVEQALERLVDGFAAARRHPIALETALGDALTVVYRILFLLFAEARGLVPQWHPVYRESYTIESLRPLAEGRRPPAGLWQSLQAIARLAHRGCTAGTLRVVPFNGRLFAPSAAPLAESFVLDDRLVREVLLAVTTRPAADRRQRICYADLGVEQLGAVYERVLEYTPDRSGGTIRFIASGKRKRTGTFYTPRSMTEYLVRRTLAPLVRAAAPGRILALRVLDPSMGSGAFLVAACRYLADAYEEALIAEGSVARADVGVKERAGFRRRVAQHCLFGVDANPTAVQLARLSLWLCTLAADRPLTFLDHHLRCGNSLAGAGLADIARQPPGCARGRAAPLPLFEADEAGAALAFAAERRAAIARQPDDTAEIVREKERAIERLHGAGGPLGRWRSVADAWCAGWFWPEGVEPVTPGAWHAFSSALRGESTDLPPRLEERWRAAVTAVAGAQGFFHWELEFPEVFYTEEGAPRADAGFDAVIGNPPWTAARSLTRFSRDSGCYRLQGDGHANLYQLFAERMLALAAAGSRVGLVMPSGLLADWGCADLRGELFDRCRVDAVATFDNHDGVFPIHRGMRFSLITLTRGGSTPDLPLRCGLRDPAILDDFPEAGTVPGAVQVPMPLLTAFSGPSRGVPDLRDALDRDVLARILAAGPPLASGDGWHLHFGRELNATDDRPHFSPRGLPVLEGKLLEPFRVRVEGATQFIDAAVARRLLGARSAVDRPRLGYREVAASTNRLTLIAAIVPPQTVTTHTIFCARERLTDAQQWFLCGVLNSYVANYCVRLRGSTHVPAAAIHSLPVPRLDGDDDRFESIASLARRSVEDSGRRARLQAAVAALYGLTREAFEHVLNTFPLVSEDDRRRALEAFAGAI